VPRSPGAKNFNPLKQTNVPLGQSKLAKDARTKTELAYAEARYLADHFQLDQYGRLDSTETGEKLSHSARRDKIDRLTAFPRMPEGEMERLVGIIERYGLPLAQLPSDTAAFVVRRVMMDYWRLSILRRRTAKPMFTPEEMVELMRALQVQVSGLAEIIAPDRKGPTINLLWRWIHGVNKPTGTTALRVNRLIEQHVRRKRADNHGRPGVYSNNRVTVERRARRDRTAGVVKDAPTTRAVQVGEKGDA